MAAKHEQEIRKGKTYLNFSPLIPEYIDTFPIITISHLHKLMLFLGYTNLLLETLLSKLILFDTVRMKYMYNRLFICKDNPT